MKKHKKKKQSQPKPRGPLFLCDRTACNGMCPNPECMYTEDISHAINFECSGGAYHENPRYQSEPIYIQSSSNWTKEDRRNIFGDLVLMKRYGLVMLPKGCKPIYPSQTQAEQPHNDIGF